MKRHASILVVALLFVISLVLSVVIDGPGDSVGFLAVMPLVGILGNLGLGNLNLGRKQGGDTQMPFKKHMGITDGDALPIVYNTMAGVLAIIGALAAGSPWTKIWETTTPAQQKRRWGFGSPTTPHNQGYMWFCSLDSITDFQVGVLRLVQAKAMETVSYVILEVDDTRLHGTTVTTLTTATPVNINEMIALPEKVEFKKVAEDSFLQLWYRCITPATAEDDVGFSIPVTVYQ